jgi:hypothetical protein
MALGAPGARRAVARQDLERAMNLPWYTNPQRPDAAYDVRAPGGYEWWLFEAHDPATDTQIVVVVYDGDPFNPEYRRRYERYRRRPTRNAPPVARDFPAVSMMVYRAGQIAVRSIIQYPAGSFSGSPEKPDLSIGADRLTSEGDNLKLDIAGAGLTFAPRWRHLPVERTLFAGHGEHRWIIANPYCDVEGFYCRSGERIALRGIGYHDHQFGTGPIPQVQEWSRGRAYFKDRVYAFHRVAHPTEFQLIMCDAGGVRPVESKDLILNAGRKLDQARTQYSAEDPPGQIGIAFCESMARIGT